MFCSTNCMKEANEKFHQFECDFSSDTFGRFFSIAVRSAVRVFLEVLHSFGGSFEELEKFFVENNSDTTVFDVDVEKEMYKRHLSLAVNSLCTNETQRSEVEKFRRAIVCTLLCDYLNKHSNLKRILADDCNARFFMKFMYRQSQIAESNYHELYALSPQKFFQENEQYGVGCFPFASLLNHSCSPNVFRLTHDGFNYIITSRCIKKDDQVFDNYG